MSRFSAVTLDLSRFPPPLALKELSFEDALAERLHQLVAEYASAGRVYDVETIKSDWAGILQRVDAKREILIVGTINDAVKAGFIAFAVGADLEHLAAFYGLSRRVIMPASGSAAAVMESDAELRRRTLLAPEAFATAGTAGGYLFHALTADIRVLNADIWSPGAGEIMVALQARDGQAEAPDEVVTAVQAHLHRTDIKPLTDVVSVRSVSTHDYAIDVTVYVRPGPDPMTVRAAVLDSLSSMAAARRMPARDVPVSAVTAAATVGPVDRVVVRSPAADVVMENGELAVCTGITVTVETHDG